MDDNFIWSFCVIEFLFQLARALNSAGYKSRRSRVEEHGRSPGLWITSVISDRDNDGMSIK